MITIDDFKKVEIKIGEIVSVENIEGSDKLLKLKVNFGTEERQVLSGIKAYFPDPQVLVGKRCPFVTTGSADTPFALFETTGAPGDTVH